MSVESSCHCGANVLRIADAPTELTDCNCSICRRYGTLWAYYRLADVDLSGARSTDTYLWDDREIAFHRCTACGCVTHWYPADPTRDRLGINARLLPLAVREAARVRRLDGAVTERYVDE